MEQTAHAEARLLRGARLRAIAWVGILFYFRGGALRGSKPFSVSDMTADLLFGVIQTRFRAVLTLVMADGGFRQIFERIMIFIRYAAGVLRVVEVIARAVG